MDTTLIPSEGTEGPIVIVSHNEPTTWKYNYVVQGIFDNKMYPNRIVSSGCCIHIPLTYCSEDDCYEYAIRNKRCRLHEPLCPGYRIRHKA